VCSQTSEERGREAWEKLADLCDEQSALFRDADIAVAAMQARRAARAEPASNLGCLQPPC
jgi:hypothetical protein